MARQQNPSGEGSITLRADGRWQARLQVGGVRKTVYATTEVQVRKKLFELQRQANGGVLPNPGTRSVNDLLDLWLETAAKTLKPTTMAWYRTMADLHIRPSLGKIRLSKLEPIRLQRLYAGLSGRTAQATHRMLHRACKMGVLWRWLEQNPTERLLPPTHTASRQEVWTPDEIRTFVQNASSHWLSPLWLIALVTGLRLGELQGLKWQDVDLENGRIRVRGNLQRIGGEWLEISPKTKAGERTISLPQEGILALRRQKVRQAEWKLRAATWHESDLVFTTESGNPLHRATVGHALARECARVGVRVIHVHGFRHLHGSLLLREHLPVPMVAARLGHSPDVLLRIYAHEIRGDDRLAVEAIGRALANH